MLAGKRANEVDYGRQDIDFSDAMKNRSERSHGQKFSTRTQENTGSALNEHSVQTALWDALDHKDGGHDNLIRVSRMPKYIRDQFLIDGDFYIYRDHAYENMVSEETAISEGRYIARRGKKPHFHNLGIEKMTKAILSIEQPTMVISTKTKDGNPAVIMVLDEFGSNGAPLYAVLSFYSNREVNGRQEMKPHIIFTVAERDYIGSGGRIGYKELITEAVKDGRVLDYNAKKRDNLSVIAEQARLGNITESSLMTNLARFRKEVNSFREKNHISYSTRNKSNRELLTEALETTVDTTTPMGQYEAKLLGQYRENIELLDELQAHLKEVNAEIRDLTFGDAPRDPARLRALKDEKIKTENRIDIYDKKLLRLEATSPLKSVLEREKKRVKQETVTAFRESTKVQKTKSETRRKLKQDGNFRKGTHYHGSGDAAVKNIYSALQDPVMILASKDVKKTASPMRSTHSVVTIVDVGQAGKSLLLPFEITAERTVNGEQMDVNVLSSAYERNVSELVREAIALENSGDVGIYYAKKKPPP